MIVTETTMRVYDNSEKGKKLADEYERRMRIANCKVVRKDGIYTNTIKIKVMRVWVEDDEDPEN